MTQHPKYYQNTPNTASILHERWIKRCTGIKNLEKNYIYVNNNNPYKPPSSTS